ncbi:MAG: PEP-CTERM sorting domain-containing protein [Puniceicoccaceae bacterium]
MKKYIVLLLASGFALTASAQVATVYEGFDYAIGSGILGQGPAGAAGTWTGNDTNVLAGSLNYTATAAALPASGGHISIDFIRPKLDIVAGSAIRDTDGDSTVWVSWLAQYTYLDGYYSAVEISASDSSSGADTSINARTLNIGKTGGDPIDTFDPYFNVMVNNTRGGSTFDLDGPDGGFSDTGVNFYVVKMNFVNGGDDSALIWVNPTVAELTGETGATVVTTGSLNGFDHVFVADFSGNGDLAFDELRVGPSLGSVAVPEPSTYALILGFLGLGFALWRRRK